MGQLEAQMGQLEAQMGQLEAQIGQLLISLWVRCPKRECKVSKNPPCECFSCEKSNRICLDIVYYFTWQACENNVVVGLIGDLYVPKQISPIRHWMVRLVFDYFGKTTSKHKYIQGFIRVRTSAEIFVLLINY